MRTELLSSEYNFARQRAMFVWPGYGNAKVVHIKRLDSDETESQYRLDPNVAKTVFGVHSRTKELPPLNEISGDYRVMKDEGGRKTIAHHLIESRLSAHAKLIDRTA